MREFKEAYIDGRFVATQGEHWIETVNPSTEQAIGRTRLANRADAELAIAAAKRAQPQLARTTKAERIAMLKQLETAVLAHADAIRDVTIEEYGGPVARAQWVSQYASQCFARAAQLVQDYAFNRSVGDSVVQMAPVGVAALIAPWNSVAGTVCNKLASAIAAGCASVIKPSELSAWQTEVTAQALHAAGLPAGYFNILIGSGNEVGDALCTSADVAKISFTGSTLTGQTIARAAVGTMKRISLGLSGKSASILLDDAHLPQALAQALAAAFMNNGQACVAGSRLLVPEHLLEQVVALVQAHVASLRVGDPHDPSTDIGPLANQAQYERIQHSIRRALAQGARLVAGGEGRPQGLKRGYYVQPTVFADVHRSMDIAQQEVFGPVLSILTYNSDADAVALANDSAYGLQAYVFSGNPERAQAIAQQLEVGAVLINRTLIDPLAPFGGWKQSGLGRESGVFGLESFLEPRAIVMA